jgi:hypothetical protein
MNDKPTKLDIDESEVNWMTYASNKARLLKVEAKLVERFNFVGTQAQFRDFLFEKDKRNELVEDEVVADWHQYYASHLSDLECEDFFSNPEESSFAEMSMDIPLMTELEWKIVKDRMIPLWGAEAHFLKVIRNPPVSSFLKDYCDKKTIASWAELEIDGVFCETYGSNKHRMLQLEKKLAQEYSLSGSLVEIREQLLKSGARRRIRRTENSQVDLFDDWREAFTTHCHWLKRKNVTDDLNEMSEHEKQIMAKKSL